jgi:hypothetical protein
MVFRCQKYFNAGSSRKHTEPEFHDSLGKAGRMGNTGFAQAASQVKGQKPWKTWREVGPILAFCRVNPPQRTKWVVLDSLSRVYSRQGPVSVWGHEGQDTTPQTGSEERGWHRGSICRQAWSWPFLGKFSFWDSFDCQVSSLSQTNIFLTCQPPASCTVQ